MKFNVKAALAGLATAAVVGGGLVAIGATPAFAAQSAPPWEFDANATGYGQIAFYNANGDQVTSGTNLSSPFQYAIGNHS